MRNDNLIISANNTPDTRRTPFRVIKQHGTGMFKRAGINNAHGACIHPALQQLAGRHLEAPQVMGNQHIPAVRAQGHPPQCIAAAGEHDILHPDKTLQVNNRDTCRHSIHIGTLCRQEVGHKQVPSPGFNNSAPRFTKNTLLTGYTAAVKVYPRNGIFKLVQHIECFPVRRNNRSIRTRTGNQALFNPARFQVQKMHPALSLKSCNKGIIAQGGNTGWNLFKLPCP